MQVYKTSPPLRFCKTGFITLQRQRIKILIIHLRLIFTMARILSNHVFLQ